MPSFWFTKDIFSLQTVFLSVNCVASIKSIAIACLNTFQSFLLLFFNCYLAVPWPTLGHSQGHSLTNLMLITAFVHIQPEGHWEPRNEVGSLSPVKHLAGFEPGTFQFLLQHLNPLSHSFLDRGS